jgi:hypothetical protein
MVVYDDLSGDTLKFDVIMAEVFTRLLRAAATPAELVAHLAEVLDLEADPRLQRLTEIALERFVRSELVEPLPGSSPTPEGDQACRPEAR